MRRILLVVPLLLVTGWAQAQALDCSVVSRPQSLPVRPTLLAPLAPELGVPSHQLGAPTGVLAQAFDESQSVDQVLLRLRIESCNNVANALPAASPNTGIIDPATYKPRTEFDNAPWRFDMSQNGKRMTADEFSAWMKARGVRVAKGATATTASAATVPGIASDPLMAPVVPSTTQAPGVPTATQAPLNAAPATQTPPVTTPPAEPPKPPQGN